MSQLYTRFDGTFFEKTRLSVMTLLFQQGELSFNYLKQVLNSSDGALYTHVEKLVKDGYAQKRKQLAGDQVQTVYSLTPRGTQEYRDYLAFLENIVLGGNQ